MVLNESLGEDGYRSLMEKGVPAGFWKRLRIRYNWRFEVLGVKGLHVWIRTMDGQREFTSLENDRGGFTCGCLPKTADIVWLNPQGKRYSAALGFDEQETYAAFEKMAKIAGDAPMMLQFETSQSPAGVAVSLRTADAILNLTKVKCEIHLE
jgi:hypothetical protein